MLLALGLRPVVNKHLNAEINMVANSPKPERGKHTAANLKTDTLK